MPQVDSTASSPADIFHINLDDENEGVDADDERYLASMRTRLAEAGRSRFDELLHEAESEYFKSS